MKPILTEEQHQEVKNRIPYDFETNGFRYVLVFAWVYLLTNSPMIVRELLKVFDF